MVETTINLLGIQNDSKDFIAVAAYKGNAIGWIQISYIVKLELGPIREIIGLVVNEQFCRKGIGKPLVNSAREWCIQKTVGK